MIEQVLANLRRQIGLSVEQKRSNIVLQRTFAAALIIHKEGLAVAQHDIPRLKIPVKEIVTRSAQQEIRQAAEIVFKRLLVERNARKPEKIILEIVQVPRDGLPIETTDGVANLIIQVTASFHLKSRQHRNHFVIGLQDRCRDVFALAIRGEKLEESRVSKIFFEISAMIQFFAIDFRDREPVPTKMLGKLQKRRVLFTHSIQDADRGALFAGKPDDLPPRATKLALQRLNPLHRRAKMLLKEPVENVH